MLVENAVENFQYKSVRTTLSPCRHKQHDRQLAEIIDPK